MERMTKFCDFCTQVIPDDANCYNGNFAIWPLVTYKARENPTSKPNPKPVVGPNNWGHLCEDCMVEFKQAHQRISIQRGRIKDAHMIAAIQTEIELNKPGPRGVEALKPYVIEQYGDFQWVPIENERFALSVQAVAALADISEKNRAAGAIRALRIVDTRDNSVVKSVDF